MAWLDRLANIFRPAIEGSFEADGFVWLQTIVQDLRYGMRMLYRNARFTAVAVLTLAIGIGVNTAIFTAYRAMVARPFDARNPGEMVNLAQIRENGASDFLYSYPDYQAYRDSLRSFNGFAAFIQDRLTLSEGATPRSQVARAGNVTPRSTNAELSNVYVVSENYFQVLGVAAIRGRTFESTSVAELLAAPSVLISENYWQQRFGNDPAIVGKTIYLNGIAFTVSGVTPRDFAGTAMAVPNFWLPINLEPLVHPDESRLSDREDRRYRMVGRLASGIGIEAARAETSLFADHLRTLHDPHTDAAKPAKVLVWPGSPFPLPIDSYPGLNLMIALIMIAAAMVLAVACANVGSLQLARARARENELRTRQALGAGRLRVIRQLLTESALVGMLAGVPALGFTWALLRIAVRVLSQTLPAEYGKFVFNVNPDLEIFAYGFGISLLAGLIFGLAPALEGAALSSTARAGTATARTRRLQDLFLAAQVALSLVLVIVGSMFIRGSIQALKMDTGYDTRHTIDLNFQFMESAKYTPARKLAFVREMRAKISAMPDVAAVTSARPPGDNRFLTAVVALGESSVAQGPKSILFYTYVQTNYFETLGIPISLGHGFRTDGESERSIILSESAAKKLWPGQNPIGRIVRLGATDEKAQLIAGELFADGSAYQVIGVARDTRGSEFDGSDSRKVYLPLPESLLPTRPILIRTHSNAAQLLRSIDSVAASVDPTLLTTISTLEDLLRTGGPFVVSSIAAVVSSAIGLLGLLLATMGIYGTVSYIVVLRTREVGIRIAIGAQKSHIVGLILGESARPVVYGLMAGILLAVGASYALRRFIYGLNSVDGVSFAGVSTLFLMVALLAAYPPSRRAMRIDPMVALRYE